MLRIGEGGRREIALLRWGLIPSWAKDEKFGARCINARAETVAEAPSFRAAFKARRCLIPADGFYEWQKVDEAKQPHRITMGNGGPFSFAGLWERWTKGPEPIETFTIVTGAPNELVRPIHDRMPVILDPADYDAWLEARDPAIPSALLRPFPTERMRTYPVSTRVNSTRNDDPELVAPIG